MGGPDLFIAYDNSGYRNPHGDPVWFPGYVDLYCYEDMPESEDEEGPDGPQPVPPTGVPGNVAEPQEGGGIGAAEANESQDGK